MEQITFRPIGIIHSEYDSAGDPVQMKQRVSKIEIFMEYNELLFRLEEFSVIDVYFQFHLSGKFNPIVTTYSGEKRGVFASRAPERPNNLGHTHVELLKVDGNMLTVKGLDAINGTPVVDIKPSDTSLFEVKYTEMSLERLQAYPRKDIKKRILAGDLEWLLTRAGQIHGHFCTGLALGVMASQYAIKKMDAFSDGLEDVIAVTETNNCFSDGVQFVSGCTFGNNSMIFKDIGKIACSFFLRNKHGFRIAMLPDAKEYIDDTVKEFKEIYNTVIKNGSRESQQVDKFKLQGKQKAFSVIKLDFDKIFSIQDVEAKLPEYAPSHESVQCVKCKELVMESRIMNPQEKPMCIDCAEAAYYLIDGHGIRKILK